MITLTEGIYDTFARNINQAISEAEIRRAWDHLITAVLDKKMTIHEEEDYKDYSFDNIVIEFKNKGLFHHSKNSLKFKEATEDRIFKYISRWSRTSNHPKTFFLGIATDGLDTAIVKVVNNRIESGELLPLSFKNILYVLRVINQNHRSVLSTQNLIDDFGIHSQIGHDVLVDLYQTLTADLSENENNKTKLFFNEWKNLYGQVATMAKWKQSQILNELRFPQNAELSVVLFTFNTYNSLLVKLLAAELVSTLDIASYNNFAEILGLQEDNVVFSKIKDELELNGFFELSGIHGFVNELLFSWYVDSHNRPESFSEHIRNLCLKLALYDLSEAQAMQSGDLLKYFYQDLIPDKLRRSLGEFYTPDWLVEYMINNLPPLKDSTILEQRCLGLIQYWGRCA